MQKAKTQKSTLRQCKPRHDDKGNAVGFVKKRRNEQYATPLAEINYNNK